MSEESVDTLSAMLSYVRGFYAIHPETGTYDYAVSVGVAHGFQFLLRLLVRHPEYVAALASAQPSFDAQRSGLQDGALNYTDAFADRIVQRFPLGERRKATV